MRENVQPAARVGVVGVGRVGSHFVDRLFLRNDVSLAGVWSGDPTRTASLPRGVKRFESRDALIDAVDVAVLCDGAAVPESAAEVVRAGKCVALEFPVDWAAREANAIGELAKSSRGKIVLLSTGVDSSDFLAAKAAIARPEFGTLRHVGWTLWSPPPLPRTAGVSLAADEFSRVAAVLWLVGCRALDVYCRMEVPPRVPSVEDGHMHGSELFLQVRFEGGVTARLDVNRRTCLSERSGWVASGSGGAYRNGRFLQVAADGEIFDVPARDEAVRRGLSESDDVDRLLRCLRKEASDDVDVLGPAVEIVEAARRSAENGQVVSPNSAL